MSGLKRRWRLCVLWACLGFLLLGSQVCAMEGSGENSGAFHTGNFDKSSGDGAGNFSGSEGDGAGNFSGSEGAGSLSGEGDNIGNPVDSMQGMGEALDSYFEELDFSDIDAALGQQESTEGIKFQDYTSKN